MSDAPPSAKSWGAAIVRPNDVPLVRRGKRGPGLSSRNRRHLYRESDQVYCILSGSAEFVLSEAPAAMLEG
jgi:hypothetical protein